MQSLLDRLFNLIFRSFRDVLGGKPSASSPTPVLFSPPLVCPTTDYEALSAIYSNRYRAAFIINFSLGFIAVLLALAPLSGLLSEHTLHKYATWLSLSEVVCVICILMVHAYGRDAQATSSPSSKFFRALGFRSINQGWRQRWAEARIAAEQVRYADLMLGFPGQKLPNQVAFSGASEEDLHNAAQLKLLSDLCATQPTDLAYQQRYREYFLKMVDNQIAYHQVNTHRYHRIHHRLHTIGNLSFYLTLLACVAHLIWHAQFLSVAAAVLPALAATCHGILASGEFSRLSEQSGEMAESLKILRNAAIKDEANVIMKDWVLKFYTMVMQEALGWHLTLRDKDVQVA